jgi:hypothetical protein
VDETTVRRALVRVGVVMRRPARAAGDYLIGRWCALQKRW